uniref:ZP domain-containing protein n=1 Tax=Plectus sambesii TaxID=2011161 RepID=A0A914VK40_9BILA
FKWPDEPAVYFSCQLTLCIAADEECNRLTPPLCGPPTKARHRRSPRLEKSASSITTRSHSLSVPVRGAVDFDLEARRLIVLPADAVINGDAKSKPMNIAVEAQIFHPESSEDATESNAKPSTTESQAEEETTVSEPAIFTTRKWSSAIGQARPVGVSPHVPSPHIPPHVPSSGALGDGAAPASKRGRHCYGP